MQIKHLAIKPNTFINLEEDDWFIVQTMVTARNGEPKAYVVLVRGQSEELKEFIRSTKMASAAELTSRIQELIDAQTK